MSPRLAAPGRLARPAHPACATLAGIVLALAGPLVQAGEGAAPTGQLRLRWDAASPNPQGPLADAQALWPGMAAPGASVAVAELELRQTLRTVPAGLPLAWTADLLAWRQQPAGGPGLNQARFNELNVSADAGAWSLGAGKKVLGWDVGYGFRPNDLVQQELRRSLLPVLNEGRPLLEAEHFGLDAASTAVWVNPQNLHASAETSRGAIESALAARHYLREGSADGFLFGRVGAHTGGSLGAALAWVASDTLELHASARALQRHDGWAMTPPEGGQPRAANPWQQATLGSATQWLVGAQWTGAQQQSLLVEAWHDGTTLSDAQWSAWRGRNAALLASPAPALARAANLAWQATPFDSPNPRQDNLFVRLAWQPERWLLTLDALLQPADRGRIVTAALQWQGERLRLNASLRAYAGPPEALVRQLPERSRGVLAATWSF